MRKITVAVFLTLAATLGALSIAKSPGNHSSYSSAFQVTATDAQAVAIGGYQCTNIHCVRPTVGRPYCGAGVGLNCNARQTPGGAYICTESLCSIKPIIEPVE